MVWAHEELKSTRSDGATVEWVATRNGGHWIAFGPSGRVTTGRLTTATGRAAWWRTRDKAIEAVDKHA